MSVSFKRTQIGKGINLNEIYDPKFKPNNIRIKFITRLREDSVCANALLPLLLVTSNSEIKSRTELSQKFAWLYGTSVGAVSNALGDYQVSGFSTSPIGDKYTMGVEIISTEVVRQLLLCILSPDLTDGKFNENYFRLRKQELIDNIAAAVNEKRSYAFLKAKADIFEGEPAAISPSGTLELAQKISQEDVLRQYKYLLRSAAIEITVCGGGGIDEAVVMIKDAFSKLERENVEEIVYRTNSPVKDSVREVCEKMSVNQSKMFMTYKSDYQDIYVCKLFTMLLGGTPFSKLFSNVREKLSLCYYCSAMYMDLKGTLVIDSGVETQNIQKAREAIERQLEAVCRGEFTDEELENTKLYICGAFRSNYDSEWDTAGWFEAQNTRGTSYTPDEVAEIIRGITREQVIECAKSFKADTVYILRPEEDCSNE